MKQANILHIFRLPAAKSKLLREMCGTFADNAMNDESNLKPMAMLIS